MRKTLFPQPKFWKIDGRWYTVQPDARGERAKSYDVTDTEAKTKVGQVTRERKAGGPWYVVGTENFQDLKEAVEALVRSKEARS